MDTAYTCKWFAPLSEVHIEEPDYHAADVWDKALLGQGCRNEGKAVGNMSQPRHSLAWEWDCFVCKYVCPPQSACLTKISAYQTVMHAQDMEWVSTVVNRIQRMIQFKFRILLYGVIDDLYQESACFFQYVLLDEVRYTRYYLICNYGYFSEGFSDNRLQNYQQLKQKYRAAGNDFETLTRIANLIFTLSDEYQVTYQYTHSHDIVVHVRLFTHLR